MPPTTLADYYRNLGLPEESWHIGPEHPGLEEMVLRVLATLARARTLELGVQAGGLAVPLIAGAAGRPDFSYTGVDSLAYPNAVPLHLIAKYLKEAGIAAPVQFIESDSTPMLRAAAAASYDLIVFDHFKPKYPIDLFLVFERDILSAEGVIILHDVLMAARAEWRVCEDVCRAFGYTWTIDANVLQGVAIARRGSRPLAGAQRRLIGMRVRSRWYAHAFIRNTRSRIGRLLRAIGARDPQT